MFDGTTCHHGVVNRELKKLLDLGTALHLLT